MHKYLYVYEIINLCGLPYRQMRVLFNAFDTHFPQHTTISYNCILRVNGKKAILTASRSMFNITDFNERLQGLCCILTLAVWVNLGLGMGVRIIGNQVAATTRGVIIWCVHNMLRNTRE